MKYSLILLSAGKGLRFGNAIPKQYLLLAGKPMIVHILERMDEIDDIKEVIVVCEKEYFKAIETFKKKYSIQKKIISVQGGALRQESVYNGLNMASCENVILHEAARPFVSVSDFKTLIQDEHDNVTYVYTIPYTVLKKNSNGYISDILNREELVNIQLPQKFVKKDLQECHKCAAEEKRVFTEDAGMMKYYLDKDIYCLKGHSYNIKVTEYSDLLLGEIMLKEGVFREG